ncbi:sensor domain-containing diguanylate cyclase [Chrysiogenes arsenatis]|uniref:sensor domain-containing diguanylate cyclase n=1 Tax=Chrysiogenes arsenatis TaxID=309797 RepID=UPI0003FAA3E5|nr:sensor domain-containing diguanylate cyclase [Chrysiogenes arsenatis]
MLEHQQIFATISMGIVVLDREMRVTTWNRWMTMHSCIREEDIVGKEIYEFYPELKTAAFKRFVQSVFQFGNYSTFSQKLHHYLIPMKNPHGSAEYLPAMQQNCTAGPIRDESGVITRIFITIQDATDYVMYEHRLIEMSKLDHLTRLYNRSHLDSCLAAEIARARRFGKSICLFMIDIDHFKVVNDTHGHLCGDYVLREMATILQQAVRIVDIVGRYGGEEFCCILPETSAENAFILAERLRSAIECAIITYNDIHLRITVSIGVAEYSGSTENTLEMLIGVADDALYLAKRQGRNRVVVGNISPKFHADASNKNPLVSQE